METESVPITDNKEAEVNLAGNSSQQTPPQMGNNKKNYLYILIVFVLFLALVYVGYILTKTTEPIKKDNSQSPKSIGCSYNGKLYKPDEAFTALDGCNSCSCGADNQISCTAMACENPNATEIITPTVESSNQGISSFTPIPLETYKDKEYGYQVAYNPNNWMFRHTYGKGGIANSDTSGTPRIISGFDLHKPSNINSTAIIVLNVMDANKETDIDQWIKKYELNVPKDASSQLIQSPYIRAREYTYRHDANDKFIRRSRYFIDSNKVFRINYSELSELSPDTIQIIETFEP